jgi:glucosamine-6-phosphate deaminase
VRVVILPDYDEASSWAAANVALAIRAHDPSMKRLFVLGLPTGSTPLGMYRELIRLHLAGMVSFAKTATFNMDEYVGLPKDHPASYHTFMRENFFRHIDIPPENVHIPDGNAPDLERECEEYEKAIARLGGVDLFVGGAGSNGHIAFNEPGSSLSSSTRVVSLAAETVAANARFFDGAKSKVPRTAITVGIGTILDARSILLIVTGPAKARSLRMAIEEGVSNMRPISAIQFHRDAVIVCDEDAARGLKPSTVLHFKNIEASMTDPRSFF